MRKTMAKKWVTALRSGEYKQGKYMLYDSKANAYCCLGVLNKIYPQLDLGGGKNSILFNYRRCGLADRFGTLDDTGAGFTSLSSFNDSGKFSFNEIADIIQIEYIEGV